MASRRRDDNDPLIVVSTKNVVKVESPLKKKSGSAHGVAQETESIFQLDIILIGYKIKQESACLLII